MFEKIVILGSALIFACHTSCPDSPKYHARRAAASKKHEALTTLISALGEAIRCEQVSELKSAIKSMETTPSHFLGCLNALLNGKTLTEAHKRGLSEEELILCLQLFRKTSGLRVAARRV